MRGEDDDFKRGRLDCCRLGCLPQRPLNGPRALYGAIAPRRRLRPKVARRVCVEEVDADFIVSIVRRQMV